MNVPKLRFKEFNDEWINKCLSNIANITMGQSPNSKNYTSNKNDIILIQGNADLNNGYVVPRVFTTQITKTCSINDIIMTVRAPVGDTAISDYNACIGRGVCAISGDKYIYHYLNYLKIKDYWKKISKGSTIDSITSNDIRNLSINFPNSDEAKKIVKTLDLLDKKIELQSKKIEDLKLFKKGLILSLKKNSFDWHTVCIKDLFKITRGVVIPKNELSEFKNGEYKYPVYSSQTSNQGILGYSDTFDFNGKYLTWTTDGANAGKVFYRNGKFRCTNVCGVLYEDNIRFTNELFAELLNYETPKHVSYVGNPKLMNNVMADIKIKIPNDDVQENISLIINTINNKVNLEKKKLLKFKELKKGLMQSMFV